MNIKHVLLLVFLCLLSLTPIFAAAPSGGNADYPWGVGISVLAPALPVAAKAVYQPNQWGWQAEFNYFYLLGMARFDGRRIVRGANGTDVYAFAGITLNHFNHYAESPAYMEFIFSADLGLGAEWRFTEHLGLGIEGGLMVPFWVNTGLDQFDNSGLMVANLHLLYWF